MDIPISTAILFSITTFITVAIFCSASGNSKLVIIILASWLALQAIVGLQGFYLVTDTLPPRFLLTLLPPIILFVALFLTRAGRIYIDNLNPGLLTILHIIRIPVELVLFFLFLNGLIPELMTFEGRNPDILSGISAPFIYYFGYVKKKIGWKGLLLWNFICLGLLINIVITAILSAPFPFQQFAFDQPNTGILHFPFIWLPACVVPLVLFSHLAVISQIIRKIKK